MDLGLCFFLFEIHHNPRGYTVRTETTDCIAQWVRCISSIRCRPKYSQRRKAPLIIPGGFQLAPSEVPRGVDEEYPPHTPLPAVESSGRIQSRPSLPIQALLQTRSHSPAPVSLAAAVTALLGTERRPPDHAAGFHHLVRLRGHIC